MAKKSIDQVEVAGKTSLDARRLQRATQRGVGNYR